MKVRSACLVPFAAAVGKDHGMVPLEYCPSLASPVKAYSHSEMKTFRAGSLQIDHSHFEPNCGWDTSSSYWTLQIADSATQIVLVSQGPS